MNEEITNIKINMAEQQRDVKYIKQKLDDHIVRQDKDMEEIRVIFNEGINSRAEKWVESVLKGILITTGLGFLSVLGGLIYQAIIHFAK